jgi:hypothetical protein
MLPMSMVISSRQETVCRVDTGLSAVASAYFEACCRP